MYPVSPEYRGRKRTILGQPPNQPQKDQPAIPSNAALDERAVAGQLALELMHEIRNPLEALGHLTYLALEEADDSEKVRKYMRLAEEQIHVLNRIASQTLGFARGGQSPTATNLVELAEAALRIHQRTIDSRKIHLVKKLPSDLLAEVHSGQLLQALSNLIVNALEALPDEGTLSLRLRRRGNSVHLVVADNGHGIDPAYLGRLGEPFFSTKGSAGNGLGLALSKRIIEDHNGRMQIRSSVRPGRNGTVFKISLPA